MGTIKLKKTSGSVSDPETRSEQACEIAADVGNAGLQSGAPRVRWEDPSVLKEYEGQTSGISRHFKLNNGTAQSVFSAMPVNYFDETEQKWKPIDNSLAEKAQSYESACGSVRTEIAKPQHGKSVKMTSPEFAVTWEYLGKQSEQPVQIAVAAAAAPVQTELLVEAQTRGNLQSKGSSATYVNADRDTDIEYSLAGNNIKENIVIKERAEDYRYLFALRTDGLKLRVSEDNENLELYSEMVDASGKTVEKQQAVIPAPFMYDAAGESSSEVYFELVPQDEGGYHFAVVASAEWINAENRAFPVTIDPVFVTSGEGCVTKQVQCRNVYTCGSGSGSGTGTTTSAWRNVDSIFVKVSKTTTMEYKSILTVKKSLMTLLDYEISSVKLRLIPYRVVSSGRFYVNNTLVNTTTSALECDITGAFKTSSGDFTVSLVPYSYSYANIDFYDSGVNAPSIVVEYLVNGKEKPVSQQFALAGGLVGEYNVLTGDIAAHFTDVPASDSVLGFGISHIYKKSSSDFHFGKNIRLNLNETLSQSGAAALGADYVYTDAYGNKHGFKDTYYYINQSGVKTSVAKSSVTVDLSGKLTYIVGGTEYEVRKEQRTKSGLTASTRLEGFRNNAYLEQRLDEVKQVEEQKEYYQNLLREFVTVDGDTGLICCYLRQYLYGHYAFERFMNTANGRYKLMTEDEALRLHDLILQLESFDLPAESGSTASSEEEQDQISQFKSSQKMSCRNQIAKLKNKHASYCDQVQKYYKEYVNLEHKLEQLERQTPVHYLTDGKTVKGFNESGRLVAVYDRRENVMTIEYDDDNRIVGVHDGEERSIALEYRPDGRLSSITDTRGRQTVYGYTAGYLTQVEFPDGRTVTLEYEGDDLSKVYSSEYGLSELDYTSASEVVVLSKSGIKSISHGAPTENKVGGEVVYAQTGKVTFRHGDNQTELEDDKQNRKVYRFDADENLYEYYEEEGGVVVKAEKYDYVPYEKDNVQSAARGSLYMKSVEAFKGSDFTGGDTVTVVLNEFNQPVTSATNARPLSVGTTQQTSVAYEYDEEHRCVRETASVSVQDGSVLLEEYQTVAACAYGMTGDVVRRESYVKGEEHTTGRTIEESEYDEKGNLIRTYTYNSLDSASKFYTESRYGENGQVLADKDESGEHETEYEYIEGTNVVREQKLPNGSRFAYGHDENDTVTAITQSTEEGEANSTQTGYTCGLVTELVSGNNRVNYT